MALGFIGSTSGSGTSNGYTVSLTGLSGGLYSAPREGDIVIVCTAFANNAASAPSVTGNNSGAYTALETAVHVNDTWDTEFLMAYKVMGATPDTSITIGRATNTAYGGATVVHVWTGQHRTLPFNQNPATVTATNTSLGDPPSVTASVSGCVAIACGAGTQGTTGSAFTVPTELTDNIVSINADGTTSDIGVWIASEPITSGVAFNPSAWSGGATSASSSCAAKTIALRDRAADFNELYLDTSDYAVFSISGQAATLTLGKSITCSAGSYSYTGVSNTLTYTPGGAENSLVCSAGSYILSGQDSTFNKTLTFQAAYGSYSISGQAATLNKTKSITADYGSYVYTGQAATLIKGRSITADVGSYSVSGQAATLNFAKVLQCSSGSYSITGQSATLNKTMNITALGGTYSITGQNATLNKGRSITCDYGQYSISGQSAELSKSITLNCGAGSYSITGYEAILDASSERQIFAECGTYLLSGQDATLTATLLNRNEKHGGDDVPERVEIWETRKIKRHDEELSRIVEENYSKIINIDQPDVEDQEEQVAEQISIPPKEIDNPLHMGMALLGEEIKFEYKKFEHKPHVDSTDQDEDDIEVLLLLQ